MTYIFYWRYLVFLPVSGLIGYLVGETVKWGINVVLKGWNSDFKMIKIADLVDETVKWGGILKKIEVKAVLFGKDTLSNKEQRQKVKKRKS